MQSITALRMYLEWHGMFTQKVKSIHTLLYLQGQVHHRKYSLNQLILLQLYERSINRYKCNKQIKTCMITSKQLLKCLFSEFGS